MIVSGKFNVPDKCPKGCRYATTRFGQGDMCSSCPVFNCSGPAEYTLLSPAEYRPDWAAEWVEFFATGKEPELRLDQP